MTAGASRRKMRASFPEAIAMTLVRHATLSCLLAPALVVAAPAVAADDAPDLRWLAGHWCATQDGADLEALWIERGGELFGLDTSTRGGELVSFGYARIEALAGGVVLVAQPGGDAPMEYALVDADDRRVAFATPDDGFPQRVDWWRDDTGLHAELVGPGENGERRVDVDYVACVDPSMPR
jgi:hypothetical protein